MDARERERESGASSHARRVFCSRRHARALSVARTLTPATLPRADRNSMRNHIAHHLASPLTSEPRSKHTQTISTRSAPSTRPRPASPAWQSPMHRSPPRAGPPLRRTSPKRRSHLRRTSRPRGKVRVWRGGVSGRRAEASPSRSIAPPAATPHASLRPTPHHSLSPLCIPLSSGKKETKLGMSAKKEEDFAAWYQVRENGEWESADGHGPGRGPLTTPLHLFPSSSSPPSSSLLSTPPTTGGPPGVGDDLLLRRLRLLHPAPLGLRGVGGHPGLV